MREQDIILLRKSIKTLNALNNPWRQKIIENLMDKPSLTVTELMFILKIEQSLVSQHLSVLYKAGFVTRTKKSKHVYYALDVSKYNSLMTDLKKLLK